jgi:flagellar motility protein MotE (MotC chaperone)
LTDSVGFKIIKGILVVVIPLLFILTFAILFLKLAGFNIKDEISQVSTHIPFISHQTQTTANTTRTEKTDPSQTISSLQNELKTANQDIEKKDQKIQELNAQIKEMDQTNKKEKQASIDAAAKAKADTISQVYQSMDPAKAAAIFAKMKDTDAASYLNMMNNQTKAKILEQMPADIAAKITPLLTGNPGMKTN